MAEPTISASTAPSAAAQLIQTALERADATPWWTLEAADRALAELGGQPSALRARALQARGLALHYSGRHAEGLGELARALAEAPQDDALLRAQLLLSLTTGHSLMGDLEGSLKHASEALEASRSLNDPGTLATAHLNAGIAFKQCGDLANGLEHLRQVMLADPDARHSPRQHMAALSHQGQALMELGRHDEAVAALERGLGLAGQQGDAALKAGLMSNLGEVYLRMDRLDDARAMLAEASEKLQRMGRLDAELDARIRLARTLLRLGHREAARGELETAMQKAHAAGCRTHVAQAHQALAELHKAAGNYQQALHHAEAYQAAERAQFNADSDRQLASLRVRMELAKARHEAEVSQLRQVQITQEHARLKSMNEALVAADAERNALLRKLNEQSRRDPLTGVANRRELDERLAAELSLAFRHGHALAVAICDIDHFKPINDRHGHRVGDRVLCALADLLRERCRTSDLVARHSGEQFCIVFPQTDGATAVQVSEALREAVQGHSWSAVQEGLSLTVSIGVSDDLGLLNHERLLADAEAQLHRAKHEGRNCVRLTQV